jgi:hypothetical protein
VNIRLRGRDGCKARLNQAIVLRERSMTSSVCDDEGGTNAVALLSDSTSTAIRGG